MALPTHIQLHIVSADRSLVNETVDEVEIPGAEGYFGVLPGHTPILALLGAGELWYRQGTEKHFLSMAFGFAEVQPDQVTILAEIAERADEIDLARAEAARKRAEERLAKPTVDMDAERARISLLKSLIRIQVATEGPRSVMIGEQIQDPSASLTGPCERVAAERRKSRRRLRDGGHRTRQAPARPTPRGAIPDRIGLGLLFGLQHDQGSESPRSLRAFRRTSACSLTSRS